MMSGLKSSDNGDKDYTHYLMSCDNILAKLVMLKGIIIDAEITNKKLMPIGAYDAESLNKWFKGRRIPAERKHLEELEDKANSSLSELLERSLALSLSDSFWVITKPDNESLQSILPKWHNINYFENDFVDEVGAFLTQETYRIDSYDSPTNTTDGVFPKKWIIINGIRYLVKSSKESIDKLDHLNEVMAYKIAEALGLRVVRYYPYGLDACICPCFVKNGQNLVSAREYIYSIEDYLEISAKDYDTLIKPFGREWIDGMLLLDYIILNKDRHSKNFGFLQDAGTGEIISPAPIFDCGASLFAVISILKKYPFDNVEDESRPFYKNHSEQIKLADLTPFKEKLRVLRDTDKIKKITQEVYGKNELAYEYIDDMTEFLKERVETVFDMI